jgi:hypothetical protein
MKISEIIEALKRVEDEWEDMGDAVAAAEDDRDEACARLAALEDTLEDARSLASWALDRLRPHELRRFDDQEARRTAERIIRAHQRRTGAIPS